MIKIDKITHTTPTKKARSYLQSEYESFKRNVRYRFHTDVFVTGKKDRDKVQAQLDKMLAKIDKIVTPQKKD